MISENELVEIGRTLKPHGVNGEIVATISDGIDISGLSCVIFDIDGIYVPFFIESSRSRGRESFLLSIDGITDEYQAKTLCGKTVFALATECGQPVDGDETDGDGFYAEDLIGFTVKTDDNSLTGEITDVDDSTDNVLFVITADDGKTVYVPVADEFIVDIDTEADEITFSLPAGLLDL
jgi:16S rRNA processing protein RimM